MHKARALALGKVMAAVAWADDQLSADEINVIKGLVHDHFSYEQFTSADWQRLDCYFVAPVGRQERQRLLLELLRLVPSQRVVDEVWQHLSSMVDDQRPDRLHEGEALEEIRQAIEQHRPRWFFTRWLTPQAPGPNREQFFVDYQDHELMFAALCELWAKDYDTPSDLEALRRGGAVSGVLMRVVLGDGEEHPQETAEVQQLLVDHYQQQPRHADILVRAAQRRGGRIDLYKCALHLRRCCSQEERRELLRQCFAIANAHAGTSHEEIAVIRKLSGDLGLEHQDFIDAKLTIPKEQRAAGH